MQQTRRFMLSGTINTRDLGGHPIPGGGVTVWGRLFRSDSVREMTEEDIRKLQKAGVTTAVDLRSAAEVERGPSLIATVPGLAYHNIDLLGGGGVWDDNPETVPHTYFSITQRTREIGSVMKVLANAPKSALFHCQAGKDRTSVIAAVLLMLAGVPDVDIEADYIATVPYVRKRLEGRNTGHRFLLDHMLPRLEYMIVFLQLFREAYGTAREFLLGVGLTEGEIAALKAKLTVPPEEKSLKGLDIGRGMIYPESIRGGKAKILN